VIKAESFKINGMTCAAGYEAVEERKDKEVAIPVGGMSCAACAKAIERAVGKVVGVAAVSVNFATEKAAVKYDPSVARLSEIKQAIVKAGYTPLALEGAKAVDEHKAAKEREIRTLWTKFAVSASSRSLSLYIAMGAMLGLPAACGDRRDGPSPALRPPRDSPRDPGHRRGLPLLCRRLKGDPGAVRRIWIPS
jgi:copper ion binding protein